MSSFLGENINEPWDYWFASPGYQEVHRPTNYFCVGKTYDSVEAAPPRVTISSIGSVEEGGSKSFTVTITGGKNKTFTVYTTGVDNVSGRVKFDDGNVNKTITPNTNSAFSANLTINGVSHDTKVNREAMRATYNNGTLLAEQLFTVSAVAFQEDSSCSGFDDSDVANPYLSVHKSGTNTVKALIIPDGASGTFNFYPQTGITVAPTAISSSSQVLTITGGNTAGAYTIDAKTGPDAASVATLHAAVLNRLDKTVVIHTIIDDSTGAAPASADVPTASSLQDYLNDTTWGPQANVYFTVSTDTTARRANFDVNQDSKLDDTSSNEYGPISIAAKNKSGTYDVNLYYQPYTILSYATLGTEAFTYGAESWFSNKHFDSINNISAHEIGHTIGRSGHSENSTDLMTRYSGNPNFKDPCHIRKADWSLVNP